MPKSRCTEFRVRGSSRAPILSKHEDIALEQFAAWNALLDRIDRFAYGENNTFLHQPGIMLGTLGEAIAGDGALLLSPSSLTFSSRSSFHVQPF